MMPTRIAIPVIAVLLQLPAWLTTVGLAASPPVRARLVDVIQESEPATSDDAEQAGPSVPVPPPPKTSRPVPPQSADPVPRRQTTPQAPAPRPAETASLASLFGLNGNRFSESLLDRAPNMYGNFLLNGPTVTGGGGGTWNGTAYFTSLGASPDALLPAGGAGRLSVADNNKAVTQDRVYFQYHHFHNALESIGSVAVMSPNQPPMALLLDGAQPIDRYLVGGEKTFWDGAVSVELRMPWTGMGRGQDFGALAFDHGELGNLTVVLKGMLYESQRRALAAGLGVETPTGSNAEFRALPTTFRLHNEATYLVPYFALTGAPTERLFCHAFTQVNIAASGNSLTYSDPNVGDGRSGVLNQPNLLQLSLASGYWLYQNPRARFLRGLATSLEFHYVSTLNDADEVPTSVSHSDPLNTYALYLSTTATGLEEQRRDLLDATVGLHAELAGGWITRIGGSFPLKSDRAFDSEVVVQVEKQF